MSLRSHITPDMRAILEVIDADDTDPYDIPTLTPILADAMEECGHPWADAMREIAERGNRPYCASSAPGGRWGWRAIYPDEGDTEWAVSLVLYETLDAASHLDWKGYRLPSTALLALAKAVTEVPE